MQKARAMEQLKDTMRAELISENFDENRKNHSILDDFPSTF